MPRQQKSLSRTAEKNGWGWCLFLEHRERRYPSGVQTHSVPLLGPYVFLSGAKPDVLYKDARIYHTLRVDDPVALSSELSALAAMLNKGVEVEVRPELQPGKEVVITHGIMEGCRGIIAVRRGTTELVVNLRILGTCVATRISTEVTALASVRGA